MTRRRPFYDTTPLPDGARVPGSRPLVGLLGALILALLPASLWGLDTLPADWGSFQRGVALYGQHQLGLALDAFKQAEEQRSALFAGALRDIDAMATDRAVQAADDSIRSLIQAVAPRDIIRFDLDSIYRQANGSLLAEIRLLRQRELSFDFSNFLRAAELIIGRKGEATVGDSFSRLRSEAAILAAYPDADFWIGKIFMAEGETKLAELQFQKAYDEREAFDSADQVYPVLESLAEVYRAQGRFQDYESRLRAIADDSGIFRKESEHLRLAMERTLSTRGIDALMALYRLDESFPLHAFSELGQFYLRDGRPLALTYLMTAVDTELSKTVEAVTAVDPVYEYGALAGHLDRIESDGELREYARTVGLYRDLYLLGEALGMGGYRQSARDIWTALARLNGIEPWNQRAAGALARPANSPPPYPLVKP
ncbi:MAG TPA: hypothetical protein VMC79_08885 [Rectinemataceae bacterium]|nr:hypothetical protein [Rectinemataceae bacterium]